MTGPLPESDPTGVNAAVLVQQLKEQAFRLGLTWLLDQATVGVGGSGPTPTVMIDGDTVPIPAVSMVGRVADGQRVFVFRIPPSGVYVVGRVGGSDFSQVVERGEAVCTLALTTAVAPALITGCQLTLTAPTDVYYEARGVFDMDVQTASTAVMQGYCYVDSVAQTRQALFKSASSANRSTTFQGWTGTLSAGVHTFELYGGKSAALGACVIQAVHTVINVTFYA